MNENEVNVWWLEDPAAPRLVGTATYIPATQGTTFRYSAGWIANGISLSGDMPLGTRPIISVGDALPGALSDALPDRWGRRVIAATNPLRREAAFDYLYYAGGSRFGALGFSRSAQTYEPHGADHLLTMKSLKEMEALVERISMRTPLSEEEKLLANSSKALGGAHPKALMLDAGVEWVVKFARDQHIDTALVEHASMTLAARCGIEVAVTRAIRLAAGHAILVRRFDRDGARRLHVLSANTALRRGVRPENPGENELSYPALASTLRSIAPPNFDRAQQLEIFRRMAFNVLIENVDDHENNHALIRRADGWVMSPAYDVLPTTTNVERPDMMIGSAGSEESLANVLSRAASFGLARDQAIEEWFAVAAVIDSWQEHFAAAHVSGADRDYLKTFIDDPARQALRRRATLDAVKALDTKPSRRRLSR